jgi:hypothetical protein
MPDKFLLRITGDVAAAKKVQKALILDLLNYFQPEKKEYDLFLMYEALQKGQKMNFLQMKDQYHLRFKNMYPQELGEPVPRMAHAIHKILKLKYDEVLLFSPLAVLNSFRSVRNIYTHLQTADVVLWRTQEGTPAVICIKNSEAMLNYFNAQLPTASPSFFSDMKTTGQFIFHDVTPPLPAMDEFFTHTPGQVRQYYPELNEFLKVVMKG